MKLCQDFVAGRCENSQTFRWYDHRGNQVAIITLYPVGLVEFRGNGTEIAIEGVGTKEQALRLK